MEWLIDIIKEWVIAKAYATEAWVLAKLYLQKAEYPGYCMPVHVTGDVDPDITCTYCRCGDYNGKPCYSREDGSYFIWWDGISRWRITTFLGVAPGGFFYRSDPSVFGDYLPSPAGYGTATVVSGYKYLTAGFVDRGDPAAVDFTVVDFKQDFAWHDLDLSSIVPAGAKAVALSILIKNSFTAVFIRFRRNGNANTKNIAGVSAQLANTSNYGDLVVSLDESRIIEYVTGPIGWLTIDLTVKAWWF